LIAAADVPANFTEAQVNPRVARLQTIFAALRARHNVADFFQVCARCHRNLSFTRLRVFIIP